MSSNWIRTEQKLNKRNKSYLHFVSNSFAVFCVYSVLTHVVFSFYFTVLFRKSLCVKSCALFLIVVAFKPESSSINWVKGFVLYSSIPPSSPLPSLLLFFSISIHGNKINPTTTQSTINFWIKGTGKQKKRQKNRATIAAAWLCKKCKLTRNERRITVPSTISLLWNMKQKQQKIASATSI